MLKIKKCIPIRHKAQYKRFTRSKVGNFFYFAFLICAGLFSVLPLIYSVVTSFKPLDELMIFPPRFFVSRPTLSNYKILPKLISNLRIPLSRYIFNSLFVSVATTVLHIICASMAAFVLSRHKFPGKAVIFKLIVLSLMFTPSVTSVSSFIII